MTGGFDVLIAMEAAIGLPLVTGDAATTGGGFGYRINILLYQLHVLS